MTNKKAKVNADNSNATASQDIGTKSHKKQETDGMITPGIVELVNMGLKRAVDIVDSVKMNTRR